MSWTESVPVLKLKMANSTEAELRQLRSSLNQSKDEVALDLKRNVFDKYVAIKASGVSTSDVNILAMPNLCWSLRKSAHWRTRCWSSRKRWRNGKLCHPRCTSTIPPPSRVRQHVDSSVMQSNHVHRTAKERPVIYRGPPRPLRESDAELAHSD